MLSAQALVETVGLEYDKFFLALKVTMGRWWALLVRQSHFIDQTLEERIAIALLDLAEKFGLPYARGTIINLRFGRRSIAELVSGSRPKVSMCLRRFALDGSMKGVSRRRAGLHEFARCVADLELVTGFSALRSGVPASQAAKNLI